MVRLNTYRCHNCSTICEDSNDFNVVICVECGKLTCGPCRTLFQREAEKTIKCKVTQKNCEFKSTFFWCLNFLHKFAPDEELQFLNYGKWCPVWCFAGCASSDFASQRIGSVDVRVHCASCRPEGSAKKNPPINTCMKIIDELRDYFSDQDYVVPIARGVELDSFECEKCCEKIRCLFYLAKTGDLLCKNCNETVTTSYSVYKGNLDFLDSFLLYIPDKDDLRLLTYSKWTPLRCELCSTLFSTNFLRTPMFHPGCSKLICNQCAWKHTCSEPNSTSLQLKWVLDVDKELRSFFKNGGNDAPETACNASELDEKSTSPLCLPSSYVLDPLSSVISAIPEKIRCERCTQLTAPTNLRMCSDCKKSCLCCICLTKEHWGHNIDEIGTSLQTAVIQKESENTLEKMSKWKESVTEGYRLYRQIDAVSVKIVDNYNCLYTKAIRESDLALLQTIRERGNIGQVQKVIDEFTGVQVKLRSSVEELEKTLSDIVETTKDAVNAQKTPKRSAEGLSGLVM